LALPTLGWLRFSNSCVGAAAPVPIVPPALAFGTIQYVAGQIIQLLCTTAAPHGLLNGQPVIIGAQDDPEIAGTYPITTQQGNLTQFWFTLLAGNLANNFPNPTIFSAAGNTTIPAPATTWQVAAFAQRALITSAGANAAGVAIGPGPSADHYTLSPGEEYLIEMPDAKCDLSQWYFQSAQNATISVIYV
jgi:hypothetical protein